MNANCVLSVSLTLLTTATTINRDKQNRLRRSCNYDCDSSYYYKYLILLNLVQLGLFSFVAGTFNVQIKGNAAGNKQGDVEQHFRRKHPPEKTSGTENVSDDGLLNPNEILEPTRHVFLTEMSDV